MSHPKYIKYAYKDNYVPYFGKIISIRHVYGFIRIAEIETISSAQGNCCKMTIHLDNPNIHEISEEEYNFEISKFIMDK